MSDSKGFAARFNHALDELPPGMRPPGKGNGRQQFVARMFRVSQKGARKWLEGEAIPRTARIASIAKRCGVNGEWLLTGQGAMRPVQVDERPARHGTSESRSGYKAPRPETARLITRLSEAEVDGLLTPADILALEGIVLRLIERT
jgi:transcriptional regulator with XRE-family HTH domain